MDKSALLERIVSDPKVMVGKPVIRGTRLTVQYILGLLAQGSTVQDILEEYGGLTPADIQACLLFAFEILEDTSFAPLPTTATAACFMDDGCGAAPRSCTTRA